MVNYREPIHRQRDVECSLDPLPLGARLRANAEILLAWMRRVLQARR